MNNILVSVLLLSLLIGVIVGGVYLAGTLTKQPVAAPQTSVSESPQVPQDTTLLTTTKSEQFDPLTYQVWKEETHDTPLHTYVIMEILVSGDITRERLDALLRRLFRQIRERKDFEYHDQPGVQVAAYTSVGRAESALWIALLDADSTDIYPEVSFSESQLDLLKQAPETRLGFTEEQRMAVFYEIVKAEDQSWKEAMQRYPDLGPGSSSEDFRRQLLKQANEQDRLLEIYEKRLASKYNLSREQLDEIGYEGANKSWPMPPSP
jgi:hypothetical protein